MKQTNSLSWIDGVIYLQYSKNLEIVLEDELRLIKKRIRFSSGVSRPVLISFEGVVNISKETREFWTSSKGARLISAMAFLVEDTYHHLLADGIIMIHKPCVPTRKFISMNEAIDWLRFYQCNN